MLSNICTSRPVSAIVSVCVYWTMCAHPLVAICATSQQAAVLTASSIWLLRSAVLVPCSRCPWSKWKLTSVSSPPHALYRWRCDQLSWPLNGTDCSSTLKQTGTEFQLLFVPRYGQGWQPCFLWLSSCWFLFFSLYVCRYSWKVINMNDSNPSHCSVKKHFSSLRGKQEEQTNKSYFLNCQGISESNSFVSDGRQWYFEPLATDFRESPLYTLHHSEARIRLIVAQSMSWPVSFSRRSSFHSGQVRTISLYLIKVPTFFWVVFNGCHLNWTVWEVRICHATSNQLHKKDPKLNLSHRPNIVAPLSCSLLSLPIHTEAVQEVSNITSPAH